VVLLRISRIGTSQGMSETSELSSFAALIRCPHIGGGSAVIV
jgi:hypothetical protein